MTPPSNRRRAVARLAFSLWTAATVAALLAPTPKHPPLFPGADKLVHASLFGGLAFLGRRGGLAPVPLLWASAGLAVGTEAAQAVADAWLYEPLGLPAAHRDADPFDALADLAGAAMGLWVAGAGARRRRNGRDSNPR